MLQRSRWVWLGAFALAILLIPLSENLLAQEEGAATGLVRPGGYLSVIKLGLIILVFLIWVWLADWVNRDAMKIGEKMEMLPETWSPIVAFPFLIGFFLAISIPIFLAGFPIFVLSAFLPGSIYFLIRRGKIKQNPNLLKEKKQKPGDIPIIEKLPQDEGVFVEFTPAGADKNEKQSNLIRARQTEGYSQLKDLILETQFKRSEQFLLDYTRDSVSVRILVDGSWHALEPMARDIGDEILASLKFLAGLNPAERRARQSGKFKLKSERGKAELLVTSQGVQTGERVQVKYLGGVKDVMKLSELGMFPNYIEKVKGTIDSAGMVIVSAPPGKGLTTTWQGTLATADRLTRDCVAIVEKDESESGIENIVIREYDQSAEGKDQFTITNGVLLTQPDMVALPKIENAKTLDFLTGQAIKQDRAVLLRTAANSASEALLRLYAQAENRDQFLKAVQHVTCQRLVRRLCHACRLEVRVQPQVIQKLGGDPRKQGTIYDQWRLPPPDQRFDERGKEIEFPPCNVCGGIGFIGRIAIFEVLTLSDELRTAIAKNPKVEAIESAAIKLGKLPLANEAYKLVLLGVTSLAEVQNALKNG
ncbi:MAG: ATPase, T2SS/T4P/T4SS family [Planctomycetota bacterium]